MGTAQTTVIFPALLMTTSRGTSSGRSGAPTFSQAPPRVMRLTNGVPSAVFQSRAASPSALPTRFESSISSAMVTGSSQSESSVPSNTREVLPVTATA